MAGVEDGNTDLTFHRTYSHGGGPWTHVLSAPPADFG